METLQGDIARATLTVVRAIKAEDDATMPTMELRFSAFGTWYEIDSFWEGRFLERTEKGAFAKTIKENRDRMRVLFDHGFDPQIGNKVLGPIEDLREEDDSPVGIVPLFDTSYNRDLQPGLEAGVYGSSMRMRVIKEEWNDEPGKSDHNPEGLPERTIKEIRLAEFGPVTFPANPDSTAGVRSLTDTFYEQLRARDPHMVDEVARSARHLRTAPPSEPVVDHSAADAAARTTQPEPAAGHSAGNLTPAQRRERLHPSLKKEQAS
jgi:HK97 family phage prohead protease